MKVMNWTEVEPAGAGVDKLPAGGYVIRILSAQERTSRKGDPYIEMAFDVAEGEHAGHYASETRDWTHSFSRSYTGNAAGFFRAFLDALEASNPGRFSVAAWQRTCDEQAFVGLVVGALFRDRMYTSAKTGKDVTVLDFVRAMPAQEAREGKFTVPPAKDDRDGAAARATPAQGAASVYGAPAAPASSPYDADIPF